MKTKLYKTLGDAMIGMAVKINKGVGDRFEIKQNDNGWFYLADKPVRYRITWAGHPEDDMFIVGPDNYVMQTVRTANCSSVSMAKRIADDACKNLNRSNP